MNCFFGEEVCYGGEGRKCFIGCVCVCEIVFFGRGGFGRKESVSLAQGGVFLKCFLEEVHFGRCSQEVLFLGVW